MHEHARPQPAFSNVVYMEGDDLFSAAGDTANTTKQNKNCPRQRLGQPVACSVGPRSGSIPIFPEVGWDGGRESFPIPGVRACS